MPDKSIKGIGQVLPEGKKVDCNGPLKDLKNREIIIEGFETQKGRKGEFAIVEAVVVRTGEKGKWITSSGTILDQLRAVDDQDAFPVRARFMVIDDYHILKNPKDLEVEDEIE